MKLSNRQKRIADRRGRNHFGLFYVRGNSMGVSKVKLCILHCTECLKNSNENDTLECDVRYRNVYNYRKEW